MGIILAKNAGFCFGVARAVKMAEEMAKEGKVYTYGPLIHNEAETNRLEKLGVFIKNDGFKPGDRVIIRSHGISEKEEEKIRQAGAKICDATCPFVKKIHNIVKEYYEKGYQIVIVGDPDHPEVLGINGRCNDSAIIINNEEDVTKIQACEQVCLVAQTTSKRIFWEKILKIIKNTCKSMVFFDTICEATNERQKEAEELSKKSDAMIVIGSRQSSNTTKLVDICKQHCKTVYHIESKDELKKIKVPYGTTGITAGASAPDWIIKEVLNTMEENAKNTELNFEEELQKSFTTLNTGDVVRGTVIGITPTEIYVDLGYKSDGILNVSEVTEDPDVKVENMLKVGDEIEAYVYRVSDVDGVVGLSMKRLVAMKGWQKVKDAYEAGEILQGKIIEVVRGGVMAVSEGVRIFIPASQANDRYMPDLSVLIGKEVPIKIRDINPSRKRVLGSVKEILVAEKAKKSEEFWAKVDAGQTEFDGVVKTLTNFGAFVDIGGVDGLIHISQLSWSHIKHPSEVLKEGDAVKVTLLEANKETGKISLGYRKAEDNPWIIAEKRFNVEDVVSVKVIRLVPFGAFVELMPGIDGLIHISQIANKRIEKPADELKIGQEVEAKITEINWETKKISLSIRALLPVAEKEAPVEEAPAEEAPAEETTEE